MNLPHLSKIRKASDDIESSLRTLPSTDETDHQQQQHGSDTSVASIASSGVVLRSAAFEREKEEAAAEAELLDTLVGLVALRGGTGGQAPPGDGGLGAEGASLGNGMYTARLSEGRESSGRVEETTLLNLLFVPDGR